jgi:hypothetical protein
MSNQRTMGLSLCVFIFGVLQLDKQPANHWVIDCHFVEGVGQIVLGPFVLLSAWAFFYLVRVLFQRFIDKYGHC